MNIIKNYIYNTLYQIMSMIIPFITMPYITRVFSPSQLGINSYSAAIASYFILFGTLGMNLYGNRQIAYVRNDEEELNKTFWSLFFVKLITCTISLACYFIFIFVTIDENINIFIIQGLTILCNIFDISWLYSGLEDFKKVVIRNITVKLVGLLLIFTLIKDENDLLLYVAISVIANIIGSIIMWFSLPKCMKHIEIDYILIKSHIKPLFRLFIPQIAIQVYGLLSKTMIGALSTTDEVAYYDYAQRIVQIVITLISSVGTVLMPRVANIVSKGGIEDVNKIVTKSFSYVSYISIPICFGLMSMGNYFVPWFLGESYSYVGQLVVISSIIIIPVSWANVIGVQYLIATKNENKYTISLIISAILNCVSNVILIKNIGAMGATISLIIAETVGVIIQFIFVRKELNVIKMIKSTINYFIASIPMAMMVFFIGQVVGKNILANILQVFAGIGIYLGLLFILKDDIQNDVFDRIKTYATNIFGRNI